MGRSRTIPWSLSNPPPPAKNWTKDEKRRCVAAANSTLESTGDEEKAIFACIAAAGKSHMRRRKAVTKKDFKEGRYNVNKVVTTDAGGERKPKQGLPGGSGIKPKEKPTSLLVEDKEQKSHHTDDEKKKKTNKSEYKTEKCASGEGGVHTHLLFRSENKTHEDGEHIHIFVLPDDTIVTTGKDGKHFHTLNDESSDITNAGVSSHAHSVVVNGKTFLTDEGGEHEHQTQLHSTANDGLHKHTLQLDDGTELESLTPGEFFSLTEDLSEEVETEKVIVGTPNEDCELPFTADLSKNAASVILTMGPVSYSTDPSLFLDPEVSVNKYLPVLPTKDEEIQIGDEVLSASTGTYQIGVQKSHSREYFFNSSGDKYKVLFRKLRLETRKASGHSCYVCKKVFADAWAYWEDSPEKSAPVCRSCSSDENFIDTIIDERGIITSKYMMPPASNKSISSDMWFIVRSDTLTPSILSKSAEIPPVGVSFLPKEVKNQVPEQYRYWSKEDDSVRTNCHKLLVEAINVGEVEIKDYNISKGTSPNADLSLYVPITKADEDERLVTGVVLEPDEVDAQNDTISAETIKEAAHEFLSEYNRLTKLGLMHRMFGNLGINLVESWIAKGDFKLGEQDIKKGTWLMTVKVMDDALWKKVKSGQITGFSIGGNALVV